MRSLFLTISVTMLFSVLNVINAATLKVPDDFSTIQEAINASINGDTVIVASGTYYENINFRGKNIVLTSYYIINEDVSYISSTIINGSQPAHPDTASCVLIVSGEDSSAILQGFTLTGGTGTKWIDEHGAGTYVEGGGVLIAYSTPTIKNNLIINNEAIRTSSGVTSAGGGGIRAGDERPTIINNIITSNSGMYGGGIVLNYTGAYVKNNIVYNNKVYQAVAGAPTFGGGGIWINSNFAFNKPNFLENNTIVGNSSSGTGSGAAGKGGGVLVWTTTVQAKNNIIYNNNQTTGTQIALVSGGLLNLTYSLVEGGWTGTGNINLNPNFELTEFYLSDSSACIDNGDPDPLNNDPEGDPGMAKWPAKGTIRNDMGAYGGPMSKQLSEFVITSVEESGSNNFITNFKLEQNYPNPFNPTTKIVYELGEQQFVTLKVFDSLGKEVITLVNKQQYEGSYEVEFSGKGLPSGVYYYQLITKKNFVTKKMILIK
jgi:hypothetical protein